MKNLYFIQKNLPFSIFHFVFRYTILIYFIPLLFIGCQPLKSGEVRYESQDLKNSDQTRVIKLDSLNNMLVEGLMWQNKKNGSWVTYFPSGQIETITNYIEGKKYGAYVKMSKDNKIIERGAYVDDLLEGIFIRYLYGSKDEQIEFHKGKKNGWARKYYMGGGVQRELQYKDDVQEGLYRFYGEDGSKMIEEMYRDGKKVSGGIVSEQ